MIPEVGLTQEGIEFTLVPAGHFILQEQGEELGIGQLAIHRLAITRFQGIQDTGH